MKPVVMDASVILKWFFEELYQENAWQYLEADDVLCLAPDFALFECAGAIRRKIANSDISPEKGETCLQKIRAMDGLEFISTINLLNRSFLMANTIGHDLYDCFYLAAAEQIHTVMVTADRKFYNRVSKSDLSHLILWIEEKPKI